MKKLTPAQATVVSVDLITMNMQRIVLKSDDFSKYPADCEGGYVKLLFNSDGGTNLNILDKVRRPVMRTYTIRQFDRNSSTIVLDFVRHITDSNEGGFASKWAMSARVGDKISVAGPGLIQGVNVDADWFYLVADMTALPALTVKLKSLPSSAIGYAVIEVNSEDDIQSLAHPDGFEVDWIVKQTNTASLLAETVSSKYWLNGQVSVWCACEFDSMRKLRQYFRNDRQVDREFIYISSYWKSGVTEDGHKLIKRQDAEEQK